MFDCVRCLAKEKCSCAVENNTFWCKIIRYRYGGTHADLLENAPDIKFCKYCGEKLDVLLNGKKYCSNVACINRCFDVL